MSTPQTPATGAAKPSLVSRLETDLVNVASKMKAGIEAAAGDAVKLAAFAQKNQPEIAALAGLAGAKSTNVEQVAMNVLSVVTGTVKAAGDAASANGLSVSFDQTLIADVKALIAEIEKI